MKKLTQQQILDLLKAIGVQDVELVEDGKEDADFDVNTFITAVDENRTPLISQKVLTAENAKIHTSVTGKVNGALRKQLSKLTGIPVAELEGKDAAEMAELALAHHSKTFDGDKQSMNDKLKEIMEAHEKTLVAKETEWSNKYNGLTEQLTNTQIMENLKAIYKTAKGISPNANIDILSADFLNDLKSKAIVKLGADGKTLELYDKANPEMRLTDASKNGFEKVENLLKPYHAPRMQWNEDTRTESAAAAMKGRTTTQQDQFTKDGEVLSPREAAMNNINTWLTEPDKAA